MTVCWTVANLICILLPFFYILTFRAPGIYYYQGRCRGVFWEVWARWVPFVAGHKLTGKHDGSEKEGRESRSMGWLIHLTLHSFGSETE